MNGITYSGIITKRKEVGLGVVSKANQLKVALAVFPDRSWYFLTSLPVGPAESNYVHRFLQNLGEKLESAAKELYCRSVADRFVPEVFAYIRSLPDHAKAPAYKTATPVDDDFVKKELESSISAALKHEDPFRAAVDFEARTPYLLADHRIIDIMSSIIKDANNAFIPVKWMQLAAADFQKKLESNSPSFQHLIATFNAQNTPSQTVPA